MSKNSAIASATPRLESVDVYRGFVMFLLGLRLLELDEVAAHFPDSAFWKFIGFHSSHVPWVGCSLNDLIHPSFAFLTGTSLAFSVASRKGKGEAFGSMLKHALVRSLILIGLGIFLRSQGRPMTNWTFEETLTQTGLGYPFLFLLAFATARVRWISFFGLLITAWLIYVSFPILPSHSDPTAFNTAADWKHDFSGFYAHWNHNRNAGWAFDIWLLNLFPRPSPYVGYLGGYASLNFITTLATMVLGYFAGTWLRAATKGASQQAEVVRRLASFGTGCLVMSGLMHYGGICPVIKHLWTPSWVFLSGGMCFLMLAGFYQIIDVKQIRGWTFPFLVLGMNSIAIYLMRHTLDEWLTENLQRHFGSAIFQILGPEFEPMLLGICSFALLWLVLLWMYRRKLFLRV